MSASVPRGTEVCECGHGRHEDRCRERDWVTGERCRCPSFVAHPALFPVGVTP